MTAFSPILELRQYTVKSGARDRFIDRFEAHFIESQEVLGARILGLFRDLDDPDRFVWMRGFDSLEARARALDGFYTGPVWKQYRQETNADIVDSDNVLLLHPVGAVDPPASARPGLIVAAIHYPPPALAGEFAAFFDEVLRPRLEAAGVRLFGQLATDPGPNSYPRLPVREGETAHVWLARFEDEAHRADAFGRLRGGWRDSAPETLLPALFRKPEILRLQPTPRSRLR